MWRDIETLLFEYIYLLCSCTAKINIWYIFILVLCIMVWNHRQDDDENLYNENRACNF